MERIPLKFSLRNDQGFPFSRDTEIVPELVLEQTKIAQKKDPR